MQIDLAGYKTVKREYKDTDISFFDVDFDKYKKENRNKNPLPVLIIENKMKSLPTKEQLEKYLEKLLPGVDSEQRKERIVLLLPFSYILDDITDYTVVTYEQLGEEMRKNISYVDDDFTRKLVEKYIAFIINIFKALDDCIAHPDLSTTTVKDYFNHEDQVMKNFYELRLSSIVWKLKMSILAERLKAVIKSKNEQLTICNSVKDYRDSTSPCRLYIGPSLANNKPIVDCFMMLDEETEFFIQFDYGFYNRGITIKSKKGEEIQLIKNKKSKDKAKSDLLKDLPPDGLQAKLLNHLGISNDKFRSYNNMFYITNDDVRSEETLECVIQKMAEEIIGIHKNYSQLNTISDPS